MPENQLGHINENNQHFIKRYVSKFYFELVNLFVLVYTCTTVLTFSASSSECLCSVIVTLCILIVSGGLILNTLNDNFQILSIYQRNHTCLSLP